MPHPKRILLVNPSMQGFYRGSRVKRAITQSPPLNIAVIAGALQRAGHRVHAIDLDGEPWLESSLEDILQQVQPDLIGMSFRTPVFGEACRIATRIRALAPGILMVAGGVHPSVRPEEVIRAPSVVAGGVHPSVRPGEVIRAPFDVAVINEGDDTMLELAAGWALEDIAGIAYLDHDTVVKTPPRAQVADLDGLARPAWNLFNLRPYSRRGLVARHPPVADLESSRGCPAKCVYCTRSLFGEGFRAKSPRRIVDEIEEAIAFGFRSFNLVDDSFTSDITRATRMCEELLRRGLRIPWTLTNGIRVSHTHEEFFIKAAASGLEIVAFGLETGSQKLLNRVGKGATLNQGRRAVKWARDAGITTMGYFMVGLPGESEESLEATLAFAKELELDFAKFSITVPLPGTELFDIWRPHIDETRYRDFSIHTPSREAFTNPDMSWDQIEGFLKRAYRDFYWRPSYLKKRLTRDFKDGNLLFNLRVAMEMPW